MTKKEIFIDACRRAHAAARERLDANESYWKERLIELRQSLVQAERHVASFHSEKPVTAVDFESELDSLFKTHLVEDVEINSSLIVIHTGLIICTNSEDGLQYELGKFEIRIAFSGRSLTIYNKTRQVDGCLRGMHAPHVNSSGHACLGNIEYPFWEMVGKLKFSVAAQLIIGFLQTVNTHDDEWGKSVVFWPLYHGDGPTRRDKDNEARRRRRFKAKAG